MNMTIYFSETDSEEQVTQACIVNYRYQMKLLKDSQKRYSDIVHHDLGRASNEAERQLLHVEAEGIEADWKRWGVEF